MALYNELPVYKKGYDLLMELYRLVTDLPKYYKYTLGSRLHDASFEVVNNIYKANAAKDKIPGIMQSRENIETIRLIIRILFDTKQISIKRMVLVNEMIEEVSKQLVGWQKYAQKN